MISRIGKEYNLDLKQLTNDELDALELFDYMIKQDKETSRTLHQLNKMLEKSNNPITAEMLQKQDDFVDNRIRNYDRYLKKLENKYAEMGE